MNNITSFKTLVGTLYKKFNKASVYGKLDLKKLYILNLVNELLFDCPTCYNEKTKRNLQHIAIKLQHSDEDICIYREERNIYTNIVGCRDCNPNNSPLQVINTKPVIIDPDPIEPPVLQPPSTCDQLLINGTGALKIVLNNFIECFEDPNGGVIKNVKITKLPVNGVLIFNEENIIENQIIDSSIIEQILYITFTDNLDSFTFQISGSNYPDLYSIDYKINIQTAGI